MVRIFSLQTNLVIATVKETDLDKTLIMFNRVGVNMDCLLVIHDSHHLDPCYADSFTCIQYFNKGIVIQKMKNFD